uniref:Protein CNPPD1 n=1 Tax=Chrysemys picta bellii TaxID=8478 RepID=A0A8C3HGY8_CHRPI
MELDGLRLDEEGTFSLSGFQEFTFLPGHQQLSERVRKRLYYGWDKDCSLDNLSSPVADIAVELLQKAAPSPIRRLQKKYVCHVSRLSAVQCAQLAGRERFLPAREHRFEHLKKRHGQQRVRGRGLACRSGDWPGALAGTALAPVGGDWSLYTDPKELFEVLSWLEGCVAKRQGTQRGWFTYTDLCVLLEQSLWQHALGQFYQQVAKLACLLGVMYLTGIAAVFASVAVVHQVVCVRSAGPAALRPLLFPMDGGRPLGSGAPLAPCVTQLPDPGLGATALYLWGSVLTALSYTEAPGSAIQTSPRQEPPLCPNCLKLRSGRSTCERSNRTSPSSPFTQPAPFGLGLGPARPDWPDPLALKQCSLEAAMDLGRIKSFIFPS